MNGDEYMVSSLMSSRSTLDKEGATQAPSMDTVNILCRITAPLESLSCATMESVTLSE